MQKKLTLLLTPAVLVVLIDQYTKYLVRTSPGLQNWTVIDGWLAFHYTQNPGMAMGLELFSTPVISVIAIAAVIAIIGYVLSSLDQANSAYLLCMGLILGGAFGNIADRIFMARLEGYGGVLEGHVVDFIHFTLQIGEWPVFPYIFNFADAAISVAIVVLILFSKKILPVPEEESPEEVSSTTDGSGEGDDPSAPNASERASGSASETEDPEASDSSSLHSASQA